MDPLNSEFFENVKIMQNTNDTRDIEKSIKILNNVRDSIVAHHPEYIDSISDIDYRLACAAFRVNNTELLEENVQRHYHNDHRFKKLYQMFHEVETTNVWNSIVRANAKNMEKTFVRSLGLIAVTIICVSLLNRK